MHSGHNDTLHRLKFKQAHTSNHNIVNYPQNQFISTSYRTARYPLLQQKVSTHVLTVARLHFLVRQHKVSQQKQKPWESSASVFHLGIGISWDWWFICLSVDITVQTFRVPCHNYRCVDIGVVFGYVFLLWEIVYIFLIFPLYFAKLLCQPCHNKINHLSSYWGGIERVNLVMRW